jgi:hypothetical protein
LKRNQIILAISFWKLFMVTLTIHAQIPIVKHDSIVIVENTLKKLNKNINFTVLPGPTSSISQSLGLVVLPVIFYDIDKKDTLSPPSSTALAIYFDFNGSWMAATKQSFYWNQNKWRASVSIGYGDLRLKFFGIGNDTMIISNSRNNYVWTHQRSFSTTLTCYRRIFAGLYGGLEYDYASTDLAGADSMSNAVLNQNGITTGSFIESFLIPSFVWDNRDNIFWSLRGFYAGLYYQLSNQIFFSGHNYSSIAGFVTGHHKLTRTSTRLSLAWFFYFQTGYGDIPYNRMSWYGDNDMVTGYTNGKYVNNSEVTAQTELRYDIWKFFGVGGYFGTGKVFPLLETFGQSVWLHFGGARLYLNVIPSRNIRVRLDVALGRQDWGVYVGIGQAF